MTVQPKTEYIAIDKLVHDPTNARKHNQKNLEAIKGSLLKYGQQKPIVVNDAGIVLAGNGTLMAARDIGWKEIWIVRSKLQGSDATGFSLADNRTSELAEWDNDILGSLLHSLREEDYDLFSIGFDTTPLDSILETPTEDDLDLTDMPKTKLVLTVTLDNDDSLQSLFIELRDRGFKVKI